MIRLPSKLLVPFVFAFIASETLALPCILREYKTGFVCVCNATYCDTFEFDTPSSDQVLVISTSKGGLRYKESQVKFGDTRTKILDNEQPQSDFSFFSLFNPTTTITINRNKSFQKVVGFGNSFTGTVSHLLKNAPALNENIFQSYYSNELGNGFNMMRLPIGGCDFDLEPWAYNEQPRNDAALSNFTGLDPRDMQRNDQLHQLMEISRNFDIKFVGSAWSPPKWMKTNDAWTGFSALKDEYFQTWANYHVKFLELMKQDGIDFWAITTGNEPLNGVSAYLFIKFMSLGWLPSTQGRWVAENLGPAMKSSAELAEVKILCGDDQRYVMPWWMDQMFQSHPQSKKFVDGQAVHWYWDKFVSPSRLDDNIQKHPNKLIISTEACSGDKPWEEHGPMLGYWFRCQDYIVDIIEDLNHHVNAWIDWNLVLDLQGGPNYVQNHVDSPIILNTTSNEEFYKQPMFYGLGHFSRFILPDSVRIESVTSNNKVFVTAFTRPDLMTTVVVYNSADHSADVDIKDPQRGDLKLNIPPRSIHSLLYK